MRKNIAMLGVVFILSLSVVSANADEYAKLAAVGDRLAPPAKPSTISKTYLKEYLKYAGKDQFIISFKLIQTKDKQEKILSNPTIVVFEGQEAKFHAGAQRPFVTGVQSKKIKGKLVRKPIVHIHKTGTNATLKVKKLDDASDGDVNIDLVLEYSTLQKQKESTVTLRGKVQSAISTSTKVRVTKSVKLGKVIEVTLSETADKKESRKLKLKICKASLTADKKSKKSSTKK